MSVAPSGTARFGSTRAPANSSKQEKAKELVGDGAAIEVVSEAELAMMEKSQSGN